MSDLIQVQPQIQPQLEPQKTEETKVVPGSPEYNAQMIAKAEAGKVAADAESRPQWLPENFKSPEDLAKSYAEAQAEITRLKQGVKQEPAKEPAEGGEKPQEPANADDTFKKFSDEFYTSGKLSEASYSELQKMGIPKAYVDEYIRNASVAQESATADLMKDFGGMEKWTGEVSQWAAKSYSPEDIQALNRVFDSGDSATIKQVLRGIYAQYDLANGSQKAPSLLSGDRSSAGYVNAYASKAEMVRDMSDPRYSKDPAFRKMVADKISKSQL
jgi:hypothetical protein